MQPGFISDLKRSFNVIDPRTREQVNMEGFLTERGILDRVANPSDEPNFAYEHIERGSIKKAWTSHIRQRPEFNDVALCYIHGPLTDEPFVTSRDFDRFTVTNESNPNNQILHSGYTARIGGISYRLNVDNTLFLDDGKPIVHQTGTGDVFTYLQRNMALRALENVEHVIITNNYVDNLKSVISEHIEHNADVTWTLRVKNSHNAGRSVPLWIDGKIVIKDPRGLPGDIDMNECSYTSGGCVVVSTRLLRASVPWYWTKRRYHENNKVFYQFERELSQLTEHVTAHVVGIR